MDKSDWSLLQEFNFSLLSSKLVVLWHSNCSSHVNYTITSTKTMCDLVKYLIKHKKEECKHLQEIKSTITIYDEVDMG